MEWKMTADVVIALALIGIIIAIALFIPKVLDAGPTQTAEGVAMEISQPAILCTKDSAGRYTIEFQATTEIHHREKYTRDVVMFAEPSIMNTKLTQQISTVTAMINGNLGPLTMKTEFKLPAPLQKKEDVRMFYFFAESEICGYFYRIHDSIITFFDSQSFMEDCRDSFIGLRTFPMPDVICPP